jgi:uncharacterized protein YdeI (YjbR/CyaY-like superfamily)
MAMKVKAKFFKSAAEWRTWLEEHHATEQELLLGFYRKELGRGPTYQEALDEALAYGWIDGVRKRYDEQRYTIRFTPRKPRSVWSGVNLKRVDELIAAGRVAEPGLRVWRERDPTKTLHYSYEVQNAKFDATMEALLRANKKAAAFFEAQPPSYKRVLTFWIMRGKKEDTRVRRMGKVIVCSARGERMDLFPARKKKQ